MADQVLLSNGDLVTEKGERIDARALLGPQAAAVTAVTAPAALTSAAITGTESPTEAEHNLLVADVAALHGSVADLVTAVEALRTALTDNGTLAAS